VFFALTGVPIVLNTSFNVFPGEPIVESPTDALRAFLIGGQASANQRIGRLVMHGRVLLPRACPLDPAIDAAIADAAAATAAAAISAAATAATAEAATAATAPAASAASLATAEAALQKTLYTFRVPVRRCGDSLRSEVLALADGSSVRVRCLVPGVFKDEDSWVELGDSLDLALLEACDGTNSLGSLVEEFATSLRQDDGSDGDDGDDDDEEKEDDEVTEAEILVRMKRLWELTLVEL
jgi:hypothetical protein